jgi:hypothetical protein
MGRAAEFIVELNRSAVVLGIARQDGSRAILVARTASVLDAW